jgi:hypothetical protein
MSDLVIISEHEKGFWQADMYRNGSEIAPSDFEQMGLAPDDFFTMRSGQSALDTMHKAQTRWPGALINIVVAADPVDDDGDERSDPVGQTRGSS